jgi:hypothetical protein
MRKRQPASTPGLVLAGVLFCFGGAVAAAGASVMHPSLRGEQPMPRQQLEALLPALRIDDGDLRRALDPPRWMACRRAAIQWTGPREKPAAAATDGSLTFVAESRCREPYDVRASGTIGPRGLVALALDRDGVLLWWKTMPEVRRVHPILMPRTGDAQADRDSARLHREGIRAGQALFDIEFPGDRRIARLAVYEAQRDDAAPAPVLLGSVAVPTP